MKNAGMRIRTDAQATRFHQRRFKQSCLVLYRIDRESGKSTRGLTLGQAYALKAEISEPRRKHQIPIPFVSALTLENGERLGFL